ncbi:MAG: carbamate kinase [Deltaproteobacteria bacterium]
MGRTNPPVKGAQKMIVSIGGNAIARKGQAGTISEQFANVAIACRSISSIIRSGRPVIITHGNGPAVGNLLIQNEAASAQVPPMPLYICNADSECSLGLIIQQSLYNALRSSDMEREIATVLTQVIVARSDTAFADPQKPIGPFYDEQAALVLSRDRGWVMKEDARRGFRRVVASPKPLRVVEAGVIKRLSEQGVIVIAAGGGGVPVFESAEGLLTGVDAVIDKDLATALLASVVKAETLLNLTGIEMVYKAFGTPSQAGLSQMSISEARSYLDKGEFEPGSMKPKIEAALEFLEDGGKEVFITTPELAEEALSGRAGTRIYR